MSMSISLVLRRLRQESVQTQRDPVGKKRGGSNRRQITHLHSGEAGRLYSELISGNSAANTDRDVEP